MDTMPAMVVMGVCGCGKSSVAQAIALAVKGTFIEGDIHHPPENVRKMSEGHPLTDEDRAGWLHLLASLLKEEMRRGNRPVLACSALKRSYREILRQSTPDLGFVFLDLSRIVAAERVRLRDDHFMPASLIDSQFATLERPSGEKGVLVIDATLPIEEITASAVIWRLIPHEPVA